MKVFISWSGKRSKELAIALRDWLPCVLQYVQPFVSEKDISAGDRWAQTIAGELESSNFGIICITPENLNSEWILFESGALSKSMQEGKLIPLLLGLELSDLSGPLSQFQAKKVEQSGLMETVQAINGVSENKTSDDIIARSVPALWPTLQTAIDAIPNHAPAEKHMRPQHEILEELVTGVRGISSRIRDFDPEMVVENEARFSKGRMAFHPRMMEEIMEVSSAAEDRSLSLLMIAGLIRNEMPWIAEVLIETYRELRETKSPMEIRNLVERVNRLIDVSIHGSFSISKSSKMAYVMMRELPFLIDSIFDQKVAQGSHKFELKEKVDEG